MRLFVLLFELVSGASATSNWPFLILAMKTCIGILNSFQIHLAWKLWFHIIYAWAKSGSNNYIVFQINENYESNFESFYITWSTMIYFWSVRTRSNCIWWQLHIFCGIHIYTTSSPVRIVVELAEGKKNVFLPPFWLKTSGITNSILPYV